MGNTPICLPTKGAPGKDGYECPVNCPCMPEDQTCDMGFDEYTGCQNAPMCMPMKGGPIGKDGIECPVTCPCKADENSCDMGFDEAMGCQFPPMCIPMKDECPAPQP